MILVGNQRGNSKDMANHLLKAENEEVIVHQLRGFLGSDLPSAFQESYAISRATNCRQHLYSLSLNPPKGAEVGVRQFEETIDRAEKRLGLSKQPRAIVFHHKCGRDGEVRMHAHAVWCRIDADKMKAIHHSYDHKKLEKLSLELFRENGWEIPRGFLSKTERDPLNYTHAEHQQARRRGKYADDIKRVFQNAWASSDSKEAFAAALKDQGYILARGDRRDFVAVDTNGEIYSIARTTGQRTKDVRTRLGEAEGLPFVGQATELAKQLPRQQSNSKNTAQEPQNSRTESPIERQVRRDPEHVLSMMGERESVFNRRDIAKALNTYVHDPVEYQAAYQKVLSSRKLKPLNADLSTVEKDIRYSTSEMIRLEKDLIQNAQKLAGRSTHSLSRAKVETAIQNHSEALKADFGVGLSIEQKQAIQHMTDDKQLSCVVGAAGAGKSTILAAAREAWEASGHRVFGAALAGKAAKGLEQSSGIKSRTLASFELSWENDRNQLQRGDVLVIDEAGMIGSKQMSRFINEAKDKGVKLVLVGDAEQLQPIEAGAPFRAMNERIEAAKLHEVHRQKQNWQKQASKDFALGNTERALRRYDQKGRIEFAKSQDDAVQALVADYLNDVWSSDGPVAQLALAHRKKDVKAINETIREARKEAGELQHGITVKTTHGRREFAVGDRLLFTRNDRDVGVQNGMLGTVIGIVKDKLTIALDDKGEDGKTRTLNISASQYEDIEHGYATTIHKSQGATVDRSYVLASRTMDRHLTYVAMTRHKQETKLYANHEEFDSFAQLSTKLSVKRQNTSTLDFDNSNQNPRFRSLLSKGWSMVKETEKDKEIAAEKTKEQQKQVETQQREKREQEDKEREKQKIREQLKRNREQGQTRER